MPRVKNLPSALKFIDGIKNIKIHTAGLDDVIRSSNKRWGFSDQGVIKGNQGFWFDAKAKKSMIGTKSVDDFLSMSPGKQSKYLESSTFSPEVRSRVDNNINEMSPDFKKSLEAGAPAAHKVKIEIMSPDGKTIKNKSKFTKLIRNVNIALGLGAMGFTLLSLYELAKSRSGCFLVGPDGSEKKVSSDRCSCEGGVSNPNSVECCKACGDMLCPGETWEGDGPGPPEYSCPLDVASGGRARSMRAEISVATDLNLKRASSQPSTLSSGKSEVCHMCGCTDTEWKLCYRDVSILDVIVEAVAGAGKKLTEGLDVILDGLGKILSTVFSVFIIIGGVVGVVMVVSVIMMVVRATKKRKMSRR